MATVMALILLTPCHGWPRSQGRQRMTSSVLGRELGPGRVQRLMAGRGGRGEGSLEGRGQDRARTFRGSEGGYERGRHGSVLVETERRLHSSDGGHDRVGSTTLWSPQRRVLRGILAGYGGEVYLGDRVQEGRELRRKGRRKHRHKAKGYVEICEGTKR